MPEMANVRFVTVECTIMSDLNETEEDLNLYYWVIHWFIDVIDMAQTESPLKVIERKKHNK